jgi:hypothetical protein
MVPMANALPIERFDASNPAERLARELERKLSLIEDRPESVFTWSDLARRARALVQRFAMVLDVR